jgi:dipeptidyl aminopeptidase/acylaminoacyl peptidase
MAGRPYIDLVKGFEYIENNLSYVDTTRAVALGASYGGYMVNWIQGHPLGRKFKALVTHDGVFSTLNQWSSEELFFPRHDFGGTLWDNRENYEKWDPAAHLKEWATPHLIIHNELDYRLPIGEGLAPFNVLQTKGIPSKFLTFPDENHVSTAICFLQRRKSLMIFIVGTKARKLTGMAQGSIRLDQQVQWNNRGATAIKEESVPDDNGVRTYKNSVNIGC